MRTVRLTIPMAIVASPRRARKKISIARSMLLAYAVKQPGDHHSDGGDDE